MSLLEREDNTVEVLDRQANSSSMRRLRSDKLEGLSRRHSINLTADQVLECGGSAYGRVRLAIVLRSRGRTSRLTRSVERGNGPCRNVR